MKCVNVINTSDAIRAIGEALLGGSNWKDVLQGLAEDTAVILEAKVEEFIGNIESSVQMPIQDYIASNRRSFAKVWIGIQDSLLREFQDKVENKYAEIDKTTNDIKLEFGSGDPAGYDRVQKDFVKNIAKSSIFNMELDGLYIKRITSPLSGPQSRLDEKLNRGIFEFKKELLKRIAAFTDINADVDFYMNDALFTDTIVKALTLFEEACKNGFDQKSETYISAHDAYVTLKYFDTFMSEMKFIEPKPSYQSSAGYGTQMYTFVGMSSNPASRFGQNEMQNSIFVNSPVLSLVFDNMPEVIREKGTDGISKFRLKNDPSKGQVMVGSNAFMNIMNNFRLWLFSQGETESLADMNTSELLSRLEEFLDKHSIPDVNFTQYATRYPDKLAGIIAVFSSDMDEKTLQSIWKYVNTNVGMLYDMYIMKNGILHRQGGKQRLINLQEIKILDRIRNAVYEYGTLNKEGFDKLCKQYGVQIKGREVFFNVSDSNPEGTIKLVLNKSDQIDLYYLRNGKWESTLSEITYTNNGKTEVLPALDVNALNERIKPFIESLLGMIPDGWQQYTDTKDLLDLFGQAVGCTLLAIKGENPSKFRFNAIGDNNVKYLQTNSEPFKNKLQSLSEMFAAAYGADTTVTLKNLNGDSIPAFSLTSWIHNFKRTRNKLRNEAQENGTRNALGTNFVYQNYLKIGAPFCRRDMQIGDTNTQPTQFTENEVTYLGIVCDYFESLYDPKNDAIHLQNTANSDKGTHWIIPYGKDIVLGNIDGKEVTLDKALKNILEGTNVVESISLLSKTMYDSRRGEYQAIAAGLIDDFNEVFGWSLSTEDDELLDSIEQIADFVNNYPNSEYYGTYKTVQQAFNSKGVEFVNELHTTKGKTFNPSLLDELRLYCGKDSKNFESRLSKQLEYFVKDLTDSGFELNFFDDRNVSEILQKLPDKGKGWVDTKSGNILFSRTINGKLEYNPLFVSYFLCDALCSTEFNKMTNGFSWMHNGKYSPEILNGDYLRTDGKASTGKDGEELRAKDGSVITVSRKGNNFSFTKVDPETKQKASANLSEAEFHEDYFIHDAAKRLAASYKRTVINGASIEPCSPQQFGVGSSFNFLFVEDIPGTVWNMMGQQEKKLDSMDGSSLVHPVFAVLEGWSSPSGKVTYDNKTICGDLSAKFGLPTLIKHAEFGLTNNRRQMGYMSDASAETAYETLSSIPLCQYIPLEKYYGYSVNSEDKTEFNKDDVVPLYKKDPFTGKTYLIHNITTNPAERVDENNNVYVITECSYSLTEVDPNTGRRIGNSSRESREIHTLYDIDQILGGAWNMKLGENGLEDYDGNISTLAYLVCNEDIKDKLIAYMVNNSAGKVGNRNVNSKDIFNRNFARMSDGRIDYSKLLLSTCSTYNLGRQMNPDHELEFAEVSEMSQMISALIQGGHFTKLVNNIYKEIGKVAAQAMRLTQEALDKNDPDLIYRLLGESLMEAFETGNRNTTGLAQSFLVKAKKCLQDNNIKYEIPFSGPTINATFISDVVSSINKKGIRRKYSGIASVLIPSHNMIQYYNLDGKNMMFSEFAKEITKRYPRQVEPGETTEQSITKNKEHALRLMNDFDYAVQYGAATLYNEGEKPDIEDTVVIGNQVIKIDSWDTFDYVRNLVTKGTPMYRWHVKPRNLRQADVTFEVEGNKYSMYDLDSVRALHYLRQAKEHKKLSGKFFFGDNEEQKLVVISAALAKAGITWSINDPIPSNIDSWIRSLDLQMRSDLAALDTGIIDNQIAFGIPGEVRIPIKNLISRHAEMIMGRLHAAELGLNPGENINDIREQGQDFFYNKIKLRQKVNKAKDVYDYAITTNTGHTLYVSVRANHSKQDLAPYRVDNKDFAQEDTGVWYNHSEKISDYISDNCKIVSIQNEAKEVCPLVIVDSTEEALKLLRGEGVDFINYNITSRNFKEVVKTAYGKQLSQDGIILRKANRNHKDPLVLTASVVENFDSLNENQQRDLIAKTKEHLDSRNEDRITKLAHKQWLAFQAQLYYVGARIPTQSMQSFQALELIGFSESLKNEVYVPKSQTWLQGSDYDVDKLYIMSYYLGKNGVLPTFSALENEPRLNHLSTILALDAPNGVQYSTLDTKIQELGDGVHHLLKNVSVEKSSLPGGSTAYRMFFRNDPDTYIELINDAGTEVFTLTNPTGEVKDSVALLKAFVELSPTGSIFKSDESTATATILNGILRGKHLIVDNNLIIKNPDNFEHEYVIHVTAEDCLKVTNMQDFRIFNKIMDSKSAFITFDEGLDLTQQEFLRLLNVHTQGKPAFTYDWAHTEEEVNITKEVTNAIINGDKASIRTYEKAQMFNLRFSQDVTVEEISKVIEKIEEYRRDSVKIPDKEHALQNSVLGGILELLEKRTIQAYGHNPISTDDLKSLIKPDPTEMRMNMDNPFTKFMMQVQNMVGKEVIGITAVSMKVFFAASTYFNTELDKAVESYINCDDAEFAKHLMNVLFVDYSGNSPELNTMANLNLKPLESLLTNGDVLVDLRGIIDKRTLARLQPALSKYLVNGRLSLNILLNGKQGVKGIKEKSQTQDAAQNISQLLSAATDNAKELILAKINATSEFADIWGAMLMTGHSFTEINDIMQSPFFNYISKMCKGFGMSNLHKGVTSKNVIKMMSLEGNIPSINAKTLRYALGAFPSMGLNKCFYYKMFYETDNNGNLLTIKNGIKVPIGPNATVKDLIKRSTPVYFFKPDQNGDLQKIVVDEKYIEKLEASNSQTKKDDIKYWLTSAATVAIFEGHIKSLLPNLSYEEFLSGIRSSNKAYGEEDYDTYEEDFISDAEQDFSNNEEEEWEQNITEETLTEGSEADYRMLLRYAQKFLSARAEVLEENSSRFKKFKTIVDKVLPITEEQNIAGMELGVNQGIPTNEFDFYNKLLRIENFINNSYSEAGLEKDFDIVKFIEDEDYREDHIIKYEAIKYAINPLAIISRVPNFAQMFEFYGTANKLLGRSAQFKLDFAIAKKILKGDNTKRLNSAEFKNMHNAIKDSLILSWLRNKELKLTLPQGQLIYLPREHGSIGTYYTPIAGVPINLGTIEGLATFKHLMDTYVFPELKAKYPNNLFVRTIDSVTKVNPLHEQLTMRKRMPIDMMKIDDSPISKDMFNSVMESFGQISKDAEFLRDLGISDNMTLGDAIYLYNLYVYKDSFSQDSFTRVFEIMNVYDNEALINDYYAWLAKIDRAMSLQDSVPNDEHFELTADTGENLKFIIRLNDVLYRLSGLPNADRRLGITAISNKGIKKIQHTDSFGKPIGTPLNVRCKDASDFWMELPFSGEDGLSDADLAEMGFDAKDIQQRFIPNEAQVWNATMDAIDQVCNLRKDMVIQIDNNTLEDWKDHPEKSPIDLSDQDMLIRISRAHGFIYDGKIYINTSNPNYKATTKLHELAHGVCAMLKYSQDPKERKQYYDLINSVVSAYSQEELQEKAKMYGFKNIHSSDFKEEVFVDEIAAAFKAGLDSTVFADTDRLSVNALKVRILNAVNRMLGVDVKERIPLQKIGNTDLTTIVAMFGEMNRELDSNSLSVKLIHSAEAKAFKQHLIKNTESEFNSSSEGIYYTC